MGCLIAIPIILLGILLFFSTAILRILALLFGFSRKRMEQPNAGQYQQQRNQTDEDDEEYEEYRQRSRSSYPRRKIFDEDEGEYVDYEEIKDDK